MTADDRVALTSAWPLFGLRIRSDRLVLRLPGDDDLEELMAVAQAGIHPPDVMPFGIAWSTVPSPAWERAARSLEAAAGAPATATRRSAREPATATR